MVILHKRIDLIHAEKTDQLVGRTVITCGNHRKKLLLIIVLYRPFLHLLQVTSRDIELDQAGGDHGVICIDADLLPCIQAVQVKRPVAGLVRKLFAKLLVQRFHFRTERNGGFLRSAGCAADTRGFPCGCRFCRFFRFCRFCRLRLVLCP